MEEERERCDRRAAHLGGARRAVRLRARDAPDCQGACLGPLLSRAGHSLIPLTQKLALPKLFTLLGLSFQAPHHLFHHHLTGKVRLADFKITPISVISELWHPELKKCVFESCTGAGGTITKKGANEQGARDVYGVVRDERSFAPQRFACGKCKRTFSLGTESMTSKINLWDVPSTWDCILGGWRSEERGS